MNGDKTGLIVKDPACYTEWSLKSGAVSVPYGISGPQHTVQHTVGLLQTHAEEMRNE